MSSRFRFLAGLFASAPLVLGAPADASEATASFPPLPEDQGPPRIEHRTAPASVRASESAPVLPTAAPRVGSADREPELDRPSTRAAPPGVWVLALEGATNAPVDAGLRLGAQFPFGLRVSGSYGWVPRPYAEALTGLASLGVDSDSREAVLLRHGIQGGKAWRLQAGIRPFRRIGLYLDAGYSEVYLDGSIGAEPFGTLAADNVPAGSEVEVDLTLRMWLVEVGYQGSIAERVTFGVGFGAMGTLDANTKLTPNFAVTADQIDTAEQNVAALDETLERYGIIPTLTLRLGVDLI
jgi:hypothetical protein